MIDRYIILIMIISFSCKNLYAQKELSKREMRKLRKIEQLETALNKPKIRFESQEIITSTGKKLWSKGGLLFINGKKGMFLEMLIPDVNDKVETKTLNFEIKDYITTGSFRKGNLQVFFSGIIDGETWRFKLVIEKTRRSTMQINGVYGIILKYTGRI